MRLRGCLLFGLLTLALVAPAAPQEQPAEKKAASRTLKVKLSYKGSGAVDSTHRIFVFLFDSPDFMQGSTGPFARTSVSVKDDTVVFADVAKSPVYVVAAFDPAGNYDGQAGPPPAGASMAIYSKHPGMPEPEPVKIDPGQTLQIEMTFDDSMKMP
jgi:hypothetical protein